MGELVSVIVPVYNTRKYLNRCLDSIICQTYSNIEIIIVDDGSTDGSSEECDKYSFSDSRIKVLHQNNKGSGAARNTALNMVTGCYLTFVDADDVIAPQMIEKMVSAFQEKKCELVAVGLEFVEDASSINDREKENTFFKSIDKTAFLENMFLGNYHVSIVNKMYFSKIAKENNIRFQEEYRFWEDLNFNIKYLEQIEENVVIIEDYLYHAIMRQGSQTRQKDKYSDYELIRSTKNVWDYINSADKWEGKIKCAAANLYANVLLAFFYHGGAFPELDRKQTAINIIRQIDGMPCKLSYKKKVQYYMTKFSQCVRLDAIVKWFH